MTEPLVIEDFIRDAAEHVRWVVRAVFVTSAMAEPVCVDYRVHAVRAMASPTSSYLQAKQVLRALQVDTARSDRPEVWLTNADGSAGIPRRVFEEASQARLLAGARQQLGAVRPTIKDAMLEEVQPGRLAKLAEATSETGTRSAGRPSTRDPIETLKVLAAVEAAFADGYATLDDVANRFHMSRPSIRNLLTWARHTADPPWFTTTSQGRRGGSMTPHARALLAEVLDAE